MNRLAIGFRPVGRGNAPRHTPKRRSTAAVQDASRTTGQGRDSGAFELREVLECVAAAALWGQSPLALRDSGLLRCSVRLSIVIPAFNEELLLGRCLAGLAESALELRHRGVDHEVIVCDNNSTDRTVEIARAGGAQVVFEPINQISRARNRGAAAAHGDWLLFLDADSFPAAGLLADLGGAIGDRRILGGGATVRLDGHAGTATLVVAGWNLISRVTRWAPGGFLFCETAAFRELGGFSEEMFVSEELDLSRRMKRLARPQGRRLVILHRHPLVTSARKIGLYSRREQLRFALSFLRSPRRVIRDPKLCPIWYDGRR